MNSIKDIPDETVRKLAETLKQSGLAASETEAIRMATNMSSTNSKINKTFEDRKDKIVMGLSHLNKEYSKKDTEPVQEQKYSHPQTNEIIEQTEQIIEKNISADDECECSKDENCDCNEECDCKNKEKTLAQRFKEAESDNIQGEEIISQELVDQAPLKPIVQEHKSEESTKKVAQEQPSKSELSSQSIERAPPKKDLSQMEESKVDLSDVFKFRH